MSMSPLSGAGGISHITEVKHSSIPASIHYKSIAGRYWPVRVADGPITARYGFIKNAYLDVRSFLMDSPHRHIHVYKMAKKT